MQNVAENTVHEYNTPISHQEKLSRAQEKKEIELFNLALVSETRPLAARMLVSSQHKNRVCFINAHCANELFKCDEYAEAVHTADYRLPDGSGMAIAAAMSGQRFEENLNGTDLFPLILEEAEKAGKSVFFLGSIEGNARGTALWARRNYKNLKIAGTRNGYFNPEEENEVIDQINASGADILFVAMGVPTQDIWLNKNWDRLEVGLGLGVGGLFEYYSGKIPRAPQIVRNIGFEWLWRFNLEPRRLFKRYVFGNPIFLTRAAMNAFRHWGKKVRKNSAAEIQHRALDLMIAILIVMCLSPVFAAIALAIATTSKGPILFKQERVGLNGQIFKIFKFRSMHIDAEERRSALISQSERAGICYKMKEDPRVTPVGKFLRRFSLDELPQFLNVIAGQMSIVGPRPALPCERDEYTTQQLKRLNTKPGITGLWQISGRANIPFEHQAHMDVAYINSKSIFSDLLILFLTPWVVLTGRGAY